MRYQPLLIFAFATLLATGPAYAQWDSQPSWQGQQEQMRLEELENQLRASEAENQRLRALREQERNERERSRSRSYGGAGDRSYGSSRRAPSGYR